MPRQTRRAFLRDAALGGAGLVVLSSSRAARTFAASAKVNVAIVGVGGRGKWYVDVIPKQASVVALCDVNDSKATAAYKALPDVPKFHDFRVMLDKMHKEIEGVIIAAPDHLHAVISVAVMKAGKHIFCEKPLTGCVHEARVVRQVAAKCNVVTRMGNQGSASSRFRRGVELVEDGAIGEIREAYVWCEGGGPDKKEPPQGTQPVPDYLKWDLWLGPNKDRPFHPQWLHWNAWREFGTGMNGNRGSHSGYLNFYSLKIIELWQADPASKPRIKVSAESSGVNRLSFPRWEVVHFKIPARGQLPPVAIHWVNGRGAPEWRKKIEDQMGRQLDWGDAGEKKWKDYEGGLLIGPKGRIYAKGSNSGIELLPADQFEGVDLTPQRLAPSPGMPEPEWLGAIRGEKVRVMSPFSMAGPYTEMMLLGNVATQFDAELEYDPLEGKIVNNAGADALLRRPYREGWSL
ncbi:MAG TPA: Gfo/Idh/MocA family oxidoreductase [Planctomycetota bacterium]|nr:Gfo/Idh/MocA family oxidoreductase [Planctomycetota bacterium]